MTNTYDPKTYGYRRSNFKNYFETDPESFDEKMAQKNKDMEKLGLKERACGDCNLCCKLVPVPALKKEANEWCKHCDIGVGCKIYKDRPLDCKAFSCVWAVGMIPEEYKPNKVGFYMTVDSINDAVLGMLKVYTEHHRLGATIRKLKKYKSPFSGRPKGFHITFGPEKEDSYFLHEEYEKEKGQYYGGKTFEELEEWALSDIPEQFREDFIKMVKEKAKHTW